MSALGPGELGMLEVGWEPLLRAALCDGPGRGGSPGHPLYFKGCRLTLCFGKSLTLPGESYPENNGLPPVQEAFRGRTLSTVPTPSLCK